MEALATGSWLTRDRIIRIAGLCALAAVGMIAWLFGTANGQLDYAGRPLGTDFSNIWTAGWMALHGHAADAWVNGKFIAEQQALQGPGLKAIYIWVYPPPFLLVASVLAFMPYVVALIVWQLSTLTGFTWMMHRLLPRRETSLLTLAAPVTSICLTHGHNGFLTALLLGGGLMLLDSKPVVAGLLFGCLVYKPQLALVLPVLLIAGRHWRATGGAVASSAMLIALSYALWGWPAWEAFFVNLSVARHVVIEQGAAGWEKMMSVFSAVRLWGGSIAAAYAAQSVATAASMIAIAWVSWTRKGPELRNALVCAAALISTPYAFDYDFVVLLPAMAWLYFDGERNGWLRWEKSLLAIAWIGSLPARQIAQLTHIPLGTMIPLIVASIALRRALGHRHPAVDVQRLPGDVTGLAAR